MDQGIVFRMFLYYGIATGGCIIFVVWILKKGSYVSINKRLRLFSVSVNSIINVVLRLLLIVLVVIVLIFASIPMLLDIPNAISGNYVNTSVVVTNWSSNRPDDVIKRNVNVIDLNTGKRDILYLYCKETHKGDELNVIYLPHTKWGQVIEE